MKVIIIINIDIIINSEINIKDNNLNNKIEIKE